MFTWELLYYLHIFRASFIFYLSFIINEHLSTHTGSALLNTSLINSCASFRARNSCEFILYSVSSSCSDDSLIRGVLRLPLTSIHPSSRSIRPLTPLCSIGGLVFYRIITHKDAGHKFISLARVAFATYQLSLPSR